MAMAASAGSEPSAATVGVDDDAVAHASLRPGDAVPEPPVPPACLGEGACLAPRSVWIDRGDLGIGLGGFELVYDLDEVTAPVKRRDLKGESALSVAVRLALSEVGADRLVASRFGLVEAIGIHWTVRNRLEAGAYDPLGRGVRAFPGCGPTGTYVSCANPGQYLGLRSWRALEPRRYDEPMLTAAVDVAVIAWWLVDSGLAEDPTAGGTNFVHHCGGRAYGLKTEFCDGWMGGSKANDVAGADPVTGPLAFKAPGDLTPGGWYRLHLSARVDFAPWDEPAPVGDTPSRVARLASGLGPRVSDEMLNSLSRARALR